MWSNLLENPNIKWRKKTETKLGETLANKKVLKNPIYKKQNTHWILIVVKINKKTLDVNKAAARTIVVNNTENVKISPMNKCQNRLFSLLRIAEKDQKV